MAKYQVDFSGARNIIDPLEGVRNSLQQTSATLGQMIGQDEQRAERLRDEAYRRDVLALQQTAAKRQDRDEQRIIDDRALVAAEKLKVDAQNKLNAEALRGTLGNVGKQDIIEDYNKIPMVNGAVSQADTDKLLAKFNAGAYTTPVNTAGLDTAGLSAVNIANIQEQNRVLAAEALKYAHGRDAVTDARNDRLDKISAQTAAYQRELFNRTTKDYNEQRAYNAGLVKNAGMQVDANPELRQELMRAGGVQAPPKAVADVYDRVKVNKATGRVEGTPADLAVIQAFEAGTTGLINDAFAKRPANIGEISDATAKQFDGTNAYANLEAIKQKMGTETAIAANKAAMAKERTDLLIAGAKSGVTGDGTSSRTGKIDTDPAKSAYAIMQYTDKNPAPQAVKDLALKLQGENYDANQIAAILSASVKTTDSTFGFGGGTSVDTDKVEAAKTSVGTPRNTKEVATQNKAMADRIAEIDRALGTGKLSLNTYAKKMESLQNTPTSSSAETVKEKTAEVAKVTTNTKSSNVGTPVKGLSSEYVYDKGHGRTGRAATIDELPPIIRSELIRNKYNTPSAVNKLNPIDDAEELRRIIDNTPLIGLGSPLHTLAANKLNTYNAERLNYIESKYGRDLYIPGSSAYAISPAEFKKFGDEYDKKYKADSNR